MSASVLTVSVISSVSFGMYKNFLCGICELRYRAADVKPSKLDVFLAGGAAGAVRVGKQQEGKVQHEISLVDTGGWKSSECLLSRRLCFHRGVMLFPLSGQLCGMAESCCATYAGFGLECQNT